MALSDDEIGQILDLLQKKGNKFYIDNEQHYKDHLACREINEELPSQDVFELLEMLKFYRMFKHIAVKTGLSLLLVGILSVIVYGFVKTG